jgi:hypothetical protein
MCPLRRFEAEGRLSPEWAEHYCMRDWEACRRYQLEERGIAHPDSLMPDGSIDERLT